MAHDSNRPLFSPFQEQSELELLHIIMKGVDVAPYPWSPSDIATSTYFEELEQEVTTLGWTEEDYAPYVQTLSTQLDQAWASLQTASTSSPSLAVFGTDLFQRLVSQVPQNLLDDIVQRVKRTVSRNLSMADQLVASVEGLLPGWETEDLLVMARPFAYAMRGPVETDVLEGTLQAMRCAEWNELSDIEQARLSLAIARYTISQLPADKA